MSNETDIDEIRQAVESLRNKRGIAALSYDRLPELSSQLYAGGEIESFVERQLLPVHFGYSGWQDLEDAYLRSKVLDHLRSIRCL